MPHQLSIFAENKPGKIEKITGIIAEGQINIRAVTSSDAGDYGIIKLLVDNPERGFELLKSENIAVNLKEIIAVKIEDKIGGLHEISKVLRENNINVNDSYGFITEPKKEAVFIFQVADPIHAENILKKEGFSLLSDRELYLI